MASTFTRPLPLALMLAFATGIPLMVTAVRVVQIPLGAWPEDAQRLAAAPVAWFLHSLAGVLFGVLGLSGLALLLQVESIATGLLDAARVVLGLGAGLRCAHPGSPTSAKNRGRRTHEQSV